LKNFNVTKADSQATVVDPVKVEDFCFDAYSEYESELNARCIAFEKKDSGILVYRRMRVAEVFSYGCSDMKQSLEWQLGALMKSMDYPADVPNFLEPWYGIGVIASSFGIDYIWNPGQAPATKPAFQTIDEALTYDIEPVKQTEIGKHTLHMVDYFLEKTKGKLPMSMCDIQSPFNNATNIVDTTSFMTSMILEPEKVLQFLNVIADLEIDFYEEQRKIIGEVLVKPGHGFASSRFFDGFGMSDDNIVMIDTETYLKLVAPSFEKLGTKFGGPVLHSCGNFSDKTALFSKIHGLKMVDGAFTPETDPHFNPAGPFVNELAGSKIVMHARMVGEQDVVAGAAKALWNNDMKLIVVTYCETAEEQKSVYELITGICK
jgi:hypothetical protein